jgi:CHAD domain-containing protein
MGDKDAPVTGGNAAVLRRSVRAELGRALAALDGRRSVSDESVHDARRALKRARAGLRLLRDALGDDEYAAENARLRDAARPLARVRDVKVMLETLDGLLARETKPRRRAALLQMRRDVSDERRMLRRELLESPDRLADIGRSLHASRRRAAQWALPVPGADAARAGLERIYRRGRKALAAADSDRSDERLHESRKQAKYLVEALRILDARGSPRATKALKRAQAVAERLGEDHDFAVLESWFAGLPPDTYEAQAGLVALVGRHRRKLQRKALKQARRLYEKKPRKRFAS